MKDPFMFILIEFIAEGTFSYWFNFVHLWIFLTNHTQFIYFPYFKL